MKYAFILVLLAAPGLAQSTSVASSDNSSAQSIPTDPESVRRARTVLDQAIQALGGQAYLTIQDVTQEGRSYSFHRGQSSSVGVTFTRMRKSWDMDRIDWVATHEIDVELIFGIEVPMGSSSTHVSLIYNGDKGYEVTNKGIRDLEQKEELEPYLRRRHFALDAVLREWLNQPGVALFYEGQKIAAQKQTDQVTVMNAKNEGVTLNLDAETHLPVRKSFSWRDPTDRQRNTEEEIYDDYRSTTGVMTPFNTTRIFNGEMAAQYFLNSASYNRALSDSLFDPRAAQQKDKEKDKKKH